MGPLRGADGVSPWAHVAIRSSPVVHTVLFYLWGVKPEGISLGISPHPHARCLMLQKEVGVDTRNNQDTMEDTQFWGGVSAGGVTGVSQNVQFHPFCVWVSFWPLTQASPPRQRLDYQNEVLTPLLRC